MQVAKTFQQANMCRRKKTNKQKTFTLSPSIPTFPVIPDSPYRDSLVSVSCTYLNNVLLIKDNLHSKSLGIQETTMIRKRKGTHIYEFW